MSADLLCEGGSEDAGDQRQHDDAADHHDSRQHSPGEGLRDSVPIAAICHRHDPPPQSCRDRTERVRLCIAFEEVFKARRGDQHDDEAEQHRDKGLAGVGDRALQTGEAGRVPGQFEDPDQTEKHRIVGIYEQVQNARQRSEEIEESADRASPTEPRSPRGATIGARRSRSAGYPQQKFGNKKNRYEMKHTRERVTVSGLPGLDGVGQYNGEAGCHHRMV